MPAPESWAGRGQPMAFNARRRVTRAVQRRDEIGLIGAAALDRPGPRASARWRPTVRLRQEVEGASLYRAAGSQCVSRAGAGSALEWRPFDEQRVRLRRPAPAVLLQR